MKLKTTFLTLALSLTVTSAAFANEFIWSPSGADGKKKGDTVFIDPADYPNDPISKQFLNHKKSVEDEQRITKAISVKDWNNASGHLIKDCDYCPELVVVPPGEFVMGSPSSEKKRGRDEGPQHTVRIAYAMAVGRFEVTQAEWEKVMGNNPSHFRSFKKPVDKISWDDAQKYISKLNQMTGMSYRLLNESEWEYVARAGTSTPFNTGDQITTDQANFDGVGIYNGSKRGKFRRTTSKVGSFQPNQFGIYDMHGNVREWVEDCYADNYGNNPRDGSAFKKVNCESRILRGGAWNYPPANLRSAGRDWSVGSNRRDSQGLRVVRTLY